MIGLIIYQQDRKNFAMNGTPGQINPLNQPSNPEESLALELEAACENFEILQRIIRSEVQMISNTGEKDLRAAFLCRMALARSFIYNTHRARRICIVGKKHNKLLLNDHLLDKFIEDTSPMALLRNSIEHGNDVDDGKRHNKASRSIHYHEDDDFLSIIIDENSLFIKNENNILAGPLNRGSRSQGTCGRLRLA